MDRPAFRKENEVRLASEWKPKPNSERGNLERRSGNTINWNCIMLLTEFVYWVTLGESSLMFYTRLS